MLTKRYSKIALTCLLLIVSKLSSAQSDSLLKFNLFKRMHFVFSITPNCSFKGKSQLIYGDLNLKTHSQLGAEAGFGFVINLNDDFGIKSGLQLGAIPFDYGYDIGAPYDSLAGFTYEDNSRSESLFDRDYFGYIEVPLQLEYRYKIAAKKYFIGSAGINLKWMLNFPAEYGFGISTSDTTGAHFLDMATEKTSKKSFTPLALSAGVGFLLKNNNMFILNLKSEIGFKNLIDGKFAFFANEPYKSKGTYNKYGSYIGVEVGYRFTNCNRNIVKTSTSAYQSNEKNGKINHKITDNDLEAILKHNQLEINCGIQFNFKPQINSATGNIPDIKGELGPRLSLDYTFSQSLHWAIKTGAALGAINYSYQNIAYYNSMGNYTTYQNLYNGFGTFDFHAGAEYREQISRFVLAFGDAGFDFTKPFGGNSTYGNYSGDSIAVAQSSVEGKISNKFLPGFDAALGLLFATRNYNMWRFAVNYHHSFAAATTESYELNINQPTLQSGTVKANGDYISVTIGYVYSFAHSPYALAKRKIIKE